MLAVLSCPVPGYPCAPTVHPYSGVKSVTIRIARMVSSTLYTPFSWQCRSVSKEHAVWNVTLNVSPVDICAWCISLKYDSLAGDEQAVGTNNIRVNPGVSCLPYPLCTGEYLDILTHLVSLPAVLGLAACCIPLLSPSYQHQHSSHFLCTHSLAKFAKKGSWHHKLCFAFQCS